MGKLLSDLPSANVEWDNSTDEGRRWTRDVCRRMVDVNIDATGRVPIAEISRAISVDCGILCRVVSILWWKMSAMRLSGWMRIGVAGGAAMAVLMTVPWRDTSLDEECAQIGMIHAMVAQSRVLAVVGSHPRCSGARGLCLLATAYCWVWGVCVPFAARDEHTGGGAHSRGSCGGACLVGG